VSANDRIYKISKTAREEIQRYFPGEIGQLGFIDEAFRLCRVRLSVIHREELDGHRVLLVRQAEPPLPAYYEAGLEPDLRFPLPSEIAQWMSIAAAYEDPVYLIGPNRPLCPEFRVTRQRLDSTRLTKRKLAEIKALSGSADWTPLAPVAILSPQAYRAAMRKVEGIIAPKRS
jgi:hypothetical protein